MRDAALDLEPPQAGGDVTLEHQVEGQPGVGRGHQQVGDGGKVGLGAREHDPHGGELTVDLGHTHERRRCGAGLDRLGQAELADLGWPERRADLEQPRTGAEAAVGLLDPPRP